MSATNPKIWYFAYGCLMNETLFKDVGSFEERYRGVLSNHRLVFHHRDEEGAGDIWAVDPTVTGVGTVVEVPGQVVHGVVYLISPSILRELDEFEGGTYDRVERHVDVVGVGGVMAQVYVGHRDRLEGHRKPTKQYLELLMGAGSMLPLEYLESLKSVETWM